MRLARLRGKKYGGFHPLGHGLAHELGREFHSPAGRDKERHRKTQGIKSLNQGPVTQFATFNPLPWPQDSLMSIRLVKHLLLRVMWFTSADSRYYVEAANGWQLWLPSLSYPRGNYINSRTYACTSACIHQQNTDKALITPWGVDWMNFTAEYTSFLLMCQDVSFVRNVITGLALDYHTQYSIIFDI